MSIAARCRLPSSALSKQRVGGDRSFAHITNPTILAISALAVRFTDFTFFYRDNTAHNKENYTSLSFVISIYTIFSHFCIIFSFQYFMVRLLERSHKIYFWWGNKKQTFSRFTLTVISRSRNCKSSLTTNNSRLTTNDNYKPTNRSGKGISLL